MPSVLAWVVLNKNHSNVWFFIPSSKFIFIKGKQRGKLKKSMPFFKNAIESKALVKHVVPVQSPLGEKKYPC